MFVATVNEQRGHKFESKQREVHGRVCQQEKEGENGVIAL